MGLQWLRDRLHNERGNVLLFTFTMLVFLLLVGRWMQLRQPRHALDAV